MRILFWLPFAVCGLILEYRNNLILAIDEYDKNLDILKVKDSPAVLLANKIGLILLGILFLSIIITFFGIAIEKYSLSVFLAIFIYTTMQVFKEILNKYLPMAVSYLPESVKQHVSLDSANNILYLTVAFIIIGVFIFILLYRLIKMVSMIIITYLLFDWVIKSHFNLPETLDITTKIAIFVLVVVLYMLLHTVYSFIFAFVFACYGGLYIISFGCHMFSNNEESFSNFLNAFYSKTPISSLKEHRETLFWVAQTALGFITQISMIKL
ncbi:hypothetical protein PAEPH01_2468 [Pancytospora epiphaga]|nr:hypothetical protein PAEPH01_2468 [Pancytospora epiphaga]